MCREWRFRSTLRLYKNSFGYLAAAGWHWIRKAPSLKGLIFTDESDSQWLIELCASEGWISKNLLTTYWKRRYQLSSISFDATDLFVMRNGARGEENAKAVFNSDLWGFRVYEEMSSILLLSKIIYVSSSFYATGGEALM